MDIKFTPLQPCRTLSLKLNYKDDLNLIYFISYFVLTIIITVQSPRVVHRVLLLRQETRIPRGPPAIFQVGLWDLLAQWGQKSHSCMPLGKLWINPG